MGALQSLDPASLDAQDLRRAAGLRGRIAVGVFGQSTERGQVEPTEAISSVLSRTAFPQAYGSLRNPAVRWPLFPALSKVGGSWFKVYDDLWDAGWEAQIVNSGIGSLSMIRDAAGLTQTRANSTGYRQKRAPVSLGDNGYAGDYMVVQGRVFICTKGLLAYATSGNGFNDTTGSLDLDYIKIVGSNATAASEPAGLATAAVGDVIVDGTVEWTCLSVTTSYSGLTYAAGSVLTESRPGFDPFGLLHRMVSELGRIPGVKHRIVYVANGQSDTGNATLTYQQALEQVGNFFLLRGLKVALGLTQYTPTSNTTAYGNLSTRVAGALTSMRASGNVDVYYPAANIITGADLYQLLGSTGNMAAGGAYFAKDSGQDNIHPNAPGSIAIGGYLSAALLAHLGNNGWA